MGREEERVGMEAIEKGNREKEREREGFSEGGVLNDKWVRGWRLSCSTISLGNTLSLLTTS